MRRRGKNTRTLENISRETFKGSSSKLLPDSTRRPRRYIWSQLFLSGHSTHGCGSASDFHRLPPKGNKSYNQISVAKKNLSEIQKLFGNTHLRSCCVGFELLALSALEGVSEFALPRPTWKSVSIGRYKEVQLFGQPGSWRSLDQPAQSSVDRV
jgi:hypothetical protein